MHIQKEADRDCDVQRKFHPERNAYLKLKATFVCLLEMSYDAMIPGYFRQYCIPIKALL